jgi:hypothetical protein
MDSHGLARASPWVAGAAEQTLPAEQVLPLLSLQGHPGVSGRDDENSSIFSAVPDTQKPSPKTLMSGSPGSPTLGIPTSGSPSRDHTGNEPQWATSSEEVASATSGNGHAPSEPPSGTLEYPGGQEGLAPHALQSGPEVSNAAATNHAHVRQNGSASSTEGFGISETAEPASGSVADLPGHDQRNGGATGSGQGEEGPGFAGRRRAPMWTAADPGWRVELGEDGLLLGVDRPPARQVCLIMISL